MDGIFWLCLSSHTHIYEMAQYRTLFCLSILLHIWLAFQLNKYFWRSVAQNHSCAITLHLQSFFHLYVSHAIVSTHLFVPLFTIAVNNFPNRIRVFSSTNVRSFGEMDRVISKQVAILSLTFLFVHSL